MSTAATPPRPPTGQHRDRSEPVALDPIAMTARLRAIPGITHVFPPSRLLTRVLDAVVALTSPDAERASQVAARTTNGTVALTANIGTSRDRSTPEIAREAADALLAAGGPNATVTVQVSRIA
jgi:hypothetical protein